MKKSFITTLSLLGVLVALVLWYTLYEKKLKITNKEAKEDSKRIVSLNRQDVQEFVIERLQNAEKKPPKDKAKYDTLKFKKTGDVWHMTSPISDKADGSMVASAVSGLTAAKQDREIDADPKDLTPYGLDVPTLRLRIRKDSTSPEEEVLFGSDTPVGYNFYVKGPKSKSVYITSRAIRSSFDKPVKDYRNKKIVDVASNEIIQLDVKTQGKSFILKQQENKSWSLARTNIPASKTEVQKTLSALVGLRAQAFPEEKGRNLGRYGLSRPQASFSLSLKDKKDPLIVTIGKVGQKAYAKLGNKGTVYEVPAKPLAPLTRTPSAYRDLALADFNRFKVSKVSLSRSAGALELEKSGEDWILKTEPETKLDKAKVEALIAKVQDTKITRYASKKTALGLKKPRLKLSLSDQEGKALVTLNFGGQKSNQVFANREGFDLPFLIKLSDFEKINLSKKAFINTAEKKTESSIKSEKTKS